MVYAIKNVAIGRFEAFWIPEVYIFGSRKSIWDPKRPIYVNYELNLVIYGLSKWENSLDGPFFWSLSWGLWPETYLKRFTLHKIIFLGSRKLISVPKDQFLRAIN